MDYIREYLAKHGYTEFRPVCALFDMDGTLYDSMPNHADAWMRMATEQGIPAERDEFFLFEGRTGASTINILFNRTFGHGATPKQVKELYGKKSEYFTQMPPVHAMPGAEDLLSTVSGAGLSCVLVTGSGQNSLLSRISTDFPGIFKPQLRITAHDVEHGKPHPEPYLKAMQLVGAQPWQSVAFENAPLGVESAARSGAFTVAITTGPIPREEMVRAGADIVYGSMPECAREFPALLQKMLQTN